MEQFKQWFDAALEAEVDEPNAMCLSTVSERGVPSSRIVLLKELLDEGFVFYTNYDSHKGLEMLANPNVSLNFLWKEMERQVRIVGTVEKVSSQRSQAYFQSRPRESQISAWTSPQSRSIGSVDELYALRLEIVKRFEDLEVLPLPPNWGGYLVKPTRVEFWQGRADRMHDRVEYSLVNSTWSKVRLAP
jgi:pyridoxamine 5'-phosphate oxidase